MIFRAINGPLARWLCRASLAVVVLIVALTPVPLGPQQRVEAAGDAPIGRAGLVLVEQRGPLVIVTP